MIQLLLFVAYIVVATFNKMLRAALNIFTITICLLSAAYFYLHLIPSIGAGINNKCLRSLRCSRYLEWGGVDAFSYRVDGADRQWRGFRSALGLLIVVSISVSGALSLIRWKILAGLREEIRWVLILRLVVGAVIVIVYHGYHSLIVFSVMNGRKGNSFAELLPGIF